MSPTPIQNGSPITVLLELLWLRVKWCWKNRKECIVWLHEHWWWVSYYFVIAALMLRIFLTWRSSYDLLDCTDELLSELYAPNLFAELLEYTHGVPPAWLPRVS